MTSARPIPCDAFSQGKVMKHHCGYRIRIYKGYGFNKVFTIVSYEASKRFISEKVFLLMKNQTFDEKSKIKMQNETEYQWKELGQISIKKNTHLL